MQFGMTPPLLLPLCCSVRKASLGRSVCMWGCVCTGRLLYVYVCSQELCVSMLGVWDGAEGWGCPYVSSQPIPAEWRLLILLLTSATFSPACLHPPTGALWLVACFPCFFHLPALLCSPACYLRGYQTPGELLVCLRAVPPGCWRTANRLFDLHRTFRSEAKSNCTTQIILFSSGITLRQGT